MIHDFASTWFELGLSIRYQTLLVYLYGILALVICWINVLLALGSQGLGGSNFGSNLWGFES
jgi:hypothetical protein